ncbi:hypothetical protein Naga_100528g6 [Nannochloropsis gaditana]|uniref:Uncharacterized protein n=1 Tax=Nannochloropsis gaditana TaxID=72520 RepID=W7T6G3_9STRA|nr:hypothetical protein Naga_100528g6 [Nannochloropsis gaditana]
MRCVLDTCMTFLGNRPKSLCFMAYIPLSPTQAMEASSRDISRRHSHFTQDFLDQKPMIKDFLRFLIKNSFYVAFDTFLCGGCLTTTILEALELIWEDQVTYDVCNINLSDFRRWSLVITLRV